MKDVAVGDDLPEMTVLSFDDLVRCLAPVFVVAGSSQLLAGHGFHRSLFVLVFCLGTHKLFSALASAIRAARGLSRRAHPRVTETTR